MTRRRIGPTVGWLALAAVAWAPLAAAQDVTQLQPAGADVRLGNLRNQFDRAFQPAGTRTAAPGWTTYSSLGIDGAYMDGTRNLTGAGRDGASIYTTITPSFGIQGDSQRLSGSLFYAPTLQQYLSPSNDRSLSQNLNGSGHVTVMPELAFIDLRAASGMQSRAGGLGPNGTASLSQQDQVQTTSLSVAPHLQYRFENLGQAQLGYTISKTNISGSQPAVASPFVSPNSNQNLVSTTPYLNLTTGSDWGRFNGGLAVKHTSNDGQGVLAHSFQNTETLSGTYALSRLWALTGSLGHENIAYGGLRPYRVNDMTWSGGTQVTPDQETMLSVSYGSKNGHPSLSFNAQTQLSQRIRFSAQYGESLGTAAEDLQNSLATSGVDSAGTSINDTTGEPVGLSSNFGGAQGGLQRSKRGSATLSWLLNREAVSFSVSQYQQSVVSNAVAGGPNSTSGVSGSIAWQHDFSEDLKGNVFVQYGQRTALGVAHATQDTMTTYLSMTYALSETLSSHMTYSYTKQNSPLATQNGGQNLLLFGLLKAF